MIIMNNKYVLFYFYIGIKLFSSKYMLLGFFIDLKCCVY